MGHIDGSHRHKHTHTHTHWSALGPGNKLLTLTLRLNPRLWSAYYWVNPQTFDVYGKQQIVGCYKIKINKKMF